MSALTSGKRPNETTKYFNELSKLMSKTVEDSFKGYLEKNKFAINEYDYEDALATYNQLYRYFLSRISNYNEFINDEETTEVQTLFTKIDDAETIDKIRNTIQSLFSASFFELEIKDLINNAFSPTFLAYKNKKNTNRNYKVEILKQIINTYRLP